MKKFGLKTILLAFGIFSAINIFAQEHKIAMSSGKLIINEVNKVEIEGYSGSEVIFSTTSHSRKRSERAAGLKAINSLGLEDNTGIGLSVNKKGGNMEVSSISRNSSTRYNIKVPKSVTIVYEHSSHHGSKLSIKNVESEIEISTNFNSVYLENVTGPMTINTVHGKIEAIFSTVSQKSPITMASAHGLIDVAIAEATKADLKLSSSWGEIFTDMNIDLEVAGDMKNIATSNVKGKLNGGGVKIDLRSTHNNIYLRKKK
ncbi:hypothetical protein QQ008_10395 [Fulvivirgaceae bacterium BMA10]|uniref:Adhesin domain-containing protein n=1 Tax=Splendidivirga corallicola TaxID=3051826 RepID=A0ABT8KM33_9BACT|nr:hypothetical protein [Fulvivirgaceae bacterium BMA10]